MAHFAHVDVNGIVLNVIVADEDYQLISDIPGGQWIQTSYNTLGGEHKQNGTPLRYNYAHIGGHYDKEADAFYPKQPYPSWTLNTTTYLWEAPTPMPTDGKVYLWNEETKEWEVPSSYN